MVSINRSGSRRFQFNVQHIMRTHSAAFYAVKKSSTAEVPEIICKLSNVHVSFRGLPEVQLPKSRRWPWYVDLARLRAALFEAGR